MLFRYSYFSYFLQSTVFTFIGYSILISIFDLLFWKNFNLKETFLNAVVFSVVFSLFMTFYYRYHFNSLGLDMKDLEKDKLPGLFSSEKISSLHIDEVHRKIENLKYHSNFKIDKSGNMIKLSRKNSWVDPGDSIEIEYHHNEEGPNKYSIRVDHERNQDLSRIIKNYRNLKQLENYL